MDLYNALYIILNIFILFVPFVLILPQRLKWTQYITIWGYIAVCRFLFERYGQITTFTIIIGCVL